jgi:hypothetical protein
LTSGSLGTNPSRAPPTTSTIRYGTERWRAGERAQARDVHQQSGDQDFSLAYRFRIQDPLRGVVDPSGSVGWKPAIRGQWSGREDDRARRQRRRHCSEVRDVGPRLDAELEDLRRAGSPFERGPRVVPEESASGFLADEQAAVVLVTEVLQDICPSVTRYLPTCYAELLEYLHCSHKAADEGCARRGCATRARRVREGPLSLRRPIGELN